MEVQRSRLLRALVHVVQMVDQPDDLVPFLEQLGRDHRKFGVLAEHYDAVGDALLTAIEHVRRPGLDPRGRAGVDRGLRHGGRRHAHRGRRPSAARRRGSAGSSSTERVGWDLAMITVQTSEPIPYRAGQYVSVETPQRPRLWRYLSPANAPARATARSSSTSARSTDGWVSRAIVAHSRVGDTWRIGPPMGRMHVDPAPGATLLMVAGGTGMAPIKALLEDIAARPEQPRTQVFVGGRTWDDLYDFASPAQALLQQPLARRRPRGREGRGAPPGAERGTLADVVTRYGAWADHDVLVCGSPAMIRATVSRMLVAGTPLDRITYDPFTMD